MILVLSEIPGCGFLLDTKLLLNLTFFFQCLFVKTGTSSLFLKIFGSIEKQFGFTSVFLPKKTSILTFPSLIVQVQGSFKVARQDSFKDCQSLVKVFQHSNHQIPFVYVVQGLYQCPFRSKQSTSSVMATKVRLKKDEKK